MAKEKLQWFPITLLAKGLEETVEYGKANKVVIDWSKVEEIKD
jgi:hypothetical protein